MADTDLPIFFEHQLDPAAHRMAAFTAKDPADREAFIAHWKKVRADDTIRLKTILCDGQVAGHVLCHAWMGEPEVTYWIGRDFWGRGIATQALSGFLGRVDARPMMARVAKDNAGSIRVLEKCGFHTSDETRGFANARDEEIDELVMRLD